MFTDVNCCGGEEGRLVRVEDVCFQSLYLSLREEDFRESLIEESCSLIFAATGLKLKDL